MRCPYHGWLFNHQGRCIEQPAEPWNSTFEDRVTTKAYPVQELAGLVFAYLGPQPAPLLPRYDLFVWDNVIRHIGITELPCNYTPPQVPVRRLRARDDHAASGRGEHRGGRHLANRRQCGLSNFFEQVTHPEAGTHPYPGGLAKFSRTPLHIRQPAPMLGQHNEAVFKGIVGVSDAEYQELLQEQVIGDTYLDSAT